MSVLTKTVVSRVEEPQQFPGSTIMLECETDLNGVSPFVVDLSSHGITSVRTVAVGLKAQEPPPATPCWVTGTSENNDHLVQIYTWQYDQSIPPVLVASPCEDTVQLVVVGEV